MERFAGRSPAIGQARWSLLHRLRSVFWTPSAPHVGIPVANTPIAADALPASLCVLVADDNPLNLMVACEMLTQFGIKSLLAADGAEAVAIATQTHLDLILMDLQMPVLDGLSATLQIRRSERVQGRSRVPVVAYTSVKSIGLHFSDYGVDDVLEKPCELRAMRECLVRWCTPEVGNEERAEVIALLKH